LNSRFLTAVSPRFGMTILFNLFSFRTAFGLALIRFPNSYGMWAMVPLGPTISAPPSGSGETALKA
jgi:hypothetical protein